MSGYLPLNSLRILGGKLVRLVWFHSHIIHVRYIYLHLAYCYGKCIDQYASPMESLGLFIPNIWGGSWLPFKRIIPSNFSKLQEVPPGNLASTWRSKSPLKKKHETKKNWVVVSVHLKNITVVSLDHFPNFQGENKGMLELPPPSDLLQWALSGLFCLLASVGCCWVSRVEKFRWSHGTSHKSQVKVAWNL